jgi:hypothetical protein
MSKFLYSYGTRLGCLEIENKYFPRDLIFSVGWFCTEPSGNLYPYLIFIFKIYVRGEFKCECSRANGLEAAATL